MPPHKTQIYIMDNGGHSIKSGFVHEDKPHITPNCIFKSKAVKTRSFIGSQIDDCKDLSGLYYQLPYQRGHLLNWEIQRQIWDHLFTRSGHVVDFHNTSLLFTEPWFNFHSVQEGLLEILLEDYQFHALLRDYSTNLSYFKHMREPSSDTTQSMSIESNPSNLCSVVVDSGYSHTYVVPYSLGEPIKTAVRRVDVGGKILTNHLKDIISYRQLMVMDETYVMNQVKEDVCFVSTNFKSDMNLSQKRGSENPIFRDYVLPDFSHIRRGFVKNRSDLTIQDNKNKINTSSSQSSKNSSTKKSLVPSGSEQLIRMSNERFMVPEILFHPSDVGLPQMGIVEAILDSVEATDPQLHPHLYSNILLTGGNALFPGFEERITMEVRSSISCDYPLNVFTAGPDPIVSAWYGGKWFAESSEASNQWLTRAEYNERGLNYCVEKYFT